LHLDYLRQDKNNMIDLDSYSQIEKVDTGNMISIITAFPEMVEEAAKDYVFSLKKKEFKNVVVCGMGGSAISGELVLSLISKHLKVPFQIVRDYSLPAYVDPSTLLIAISYSGNTEETLSCVKFGITRGAEIVAITSGGNLGSLCREKKIPFISIRAGLPPRQAVPYIFFPLMNILIKEGLIPDLVTPLQKELFVLKNLKTETAPVRREKQNIAKQIAKKLYQKIPIIFGSCGLTSGVSLRWKCQLNENSKVTSHSVNFPELNHNETVNLSYLQKGKHPFVLMILRDEEDHERIKKRIEITKSLIGQNFQGIIDVASRGKCPLARLLSLVYFGDIISYYLSILNEYVPMAIDVIDKLKKEMKR
jgi:glucose/mannose-6-phosphate isomerase